MEKTFTAITRFLEYMCTLFFGIMCVSLTIQVITRYLMGSPPFWAEELARYSMVWIVFLGAAVAAGRAAHTRIDFFISLLPAGLKRHAETLADALCIAFLLLLAWHSQPLLKIGMIMKATALGAPMLYVYLALPVGCVLMIVYFLRAIARRMAAVRQPGGSA